MRIRLKYDFSFAARLHWSVQGTLPEESFKNERIRLKKVYWLKKKKSSDADFLCLAWTLVTWVEPLASLF